MRVASLVLLCPACGSESTSYNLTCSTDEYLFISGQQDLEPTIRVVSVFDTEYEQTEIPLFFEPGHGYAFDFVQGLAHWSGEYEANFHPEDCSLSFDMEGLKGTFPTIEAQGDMREVNLWNDWPINLMWLGFGDW